MGGAGVGGWGDRAPEPRSSSSAEGVLQGNGVILPRGREFPNFYPKAVSNGQPLSLDSLPGPVDLLARFREVREQANKRSPSPRPAWKERARWGRGWGGQDKGAFYGELWRFDFRVHPLLPLVLHPGSVEVNTFPSGQRGVEKENRYSFTPAVLRVPDYFPCFLPPPRTPAPAVSSYGWPLIC